MWYNFKVNSENDMKIKQIFIFLIKNKVKFGKIKFKLVGNCRKNLRLQFLTTHLLKAQEI